MKKKEIEINVNRLFKFCNNGIIEYDIFVLLFCRIFMYYLNVFKVINNGYLEIDYWLIIKYNFN